MSFPFIPALARAAAFGAAMETGREAVRRRGGMGFLAWDDWGSDDNYFYPYESGGGYDFGGNGWDYWFGGGGGDSYNDYNWPSFDPVALPDLGPAPTTGWWQDWYDLFNPDPDAPTVSINTAEPYQLPDYRTITGDLDYQSTLWDWLNDFGPGPASMDPQYGPAGDGAGLPKPCYGPTYHPYPIGHPQQDLCIPYPPNDPNAKKQASAQQKAQQAAANAAKKAQQAQDKQCPKDPQGRPVWRNPATGKCELAPVCPTGQKFDSTTRRCLTPAQVKEIYGDNNWLIWLLIAGGALVVLNNSGGSSGGGRRR